MVTLNLEGMDELLTAFEHISKVPDDVLFKALSEMEDIAASEIKASGERYRIRDPESNVHILDKIKKGKPKRTEDGGSARISFSGSRKRGNKSVSNGYIAFIQEYGKRNQQARPFASEAMNRSSERIVKVGAKTISDWLEREFN